MDRTKTQKGSALSIMLILAMGVGSVVTSFLGRTLVEQSRVSQRAAHMRAYRQAVGQLELAKAIINSSGYLAGENIAVSEALATNPPVIPGTGVYVESAGADRWYRLVSWGEYAGQGAACTAFMRDGMPYTGYNYYVEDHSLGISGRPRGKLHSNQTLEFYFEDGFYDGFVSAVDGFAYKSGATAANTTLAGGGDPAATVKDLLDLIDFNELKATADVVTPPDIEVVVYLQKKNVRLDLWTKPTIVQVPVTKYKKVQTGTVWSPVTQTVYVKQWQWVNVQKSKKVWVPVDPLSSGTDVGGGGTAGGYWKTQYYYVSEYKQVNVPNGTTTVWKWVPVYTNVPYTLIVNQTVPGSLIATQVHDANGMFFISDNVKGISGELNGRTSIVTDHDVKVTGSIRYVDDNNNYAYLNGLDNSKPYEPNPQFVRNHALGVMAKGDILYSRSIAGAIEINGSLITTNGMVGMEGIALDTSGNPSLSGTASIKTSLRRFGSIMSAKRPVSTLLDGANQVQHGFTYGSSEYDQGLLTILPPGFPNEEIIMWQPAVKEEGAAFIAAGSGDTIDLQTLTPVTQLTTLSQVRSVVKAYHFDWGTTSCN